MHPQQGDGMVRAAHLQCCQWDELSKAHGGRQPNTGVLVTHPTHHRHHKQDCKVHRDTTEGVHQHCEAQSRRVAVRVVVGVACICQHNYVCACTCTYVCYGCMCRYVFCVLCVVCPGQSAKMAEDTIQCFDHSLSVPHVRATSNGKDTLCKELLKTTLLYYKLQTHYQTCTYVHHT